MGNRTRAKKPGNGILEKHTRMIKQFQWERDWAQFHLPKNLAISLALEAAEVLELFQWTRDHGLPPSRKAQLGDELADVYYWLLLLARECGVDLPRAFEAKMRKNARKYPVAKARGSARKYTEL